MSGEKEKEKLEEESVEPLYFPNGAFCSNCDCLSGKLWEVEGKRICWGCKMLGYVKDAK